MFPIATYSLRAEKSTLVTWPSGVLEVGQFEKAVSVGRWICGKMVGYRAHKEISIIHTIRI